MSKYSIERQALHESDEDFFDLENIKEERWDDRFVQNGHQTRYAIHRGWPIRLARTEVGIAIENQKMNTSTMPTATSPTVTPIRLTKSA